MDARVREFVRERANNRCEYCQRHQETSPLIRRALSAPPEKKLRNEETSRVVSARSIRSGVCSFGSRGRTRRRASSRSTSDEMLRRIACNHCLSRASRFDPVR